MNLFAIIALVAGLLLLWVVIGGILRARDAKHERDVKARTDQLGKRD